MTNEEENLVGQVFFYLSRGEYPEFCSASRKRVIRRKATKFQVKDGELFEEVLGLVFFSIQLNTKILLL